MVLAHHLIWSAYGWWLPNDPRGSMSHIIACDLLAELGDLHDGRKRIQPTSREIREFYDEASRLLKFPLLTFSDAEQIAIACAFAETIARENYTCYACAIMPDHVHLLIRKHRDFAEKTIEKFQDAGRLAVIEVGERQSDHPVWGGCGYKTFLDSTDDVWRTIGYVDENPTKARLPRQVFPFVTAYDNWPFHKRR